MERTTIKGCARCGEDHYNLLVRLFTNPVEIEWQGKKESGYFEITHWAMCPELNEPILRTTI